MGRRPWKWKDTYPRSPIHQFPKQKPVSSDQWMDSKNKKVLGQKSNELNNIIKTITCFIRWPSPGFSMARKLDVSRIAKKDGLYFPYVLPLTGKTHGPFRCSLAGLAISFPPLTQSPPILTKGIKTFLCSIMPFRPQRACDPKPHAKAMSHHVDHIPHGLGKKRDFSSCPPSLENPEVL